jgi:putative holliday junction resolvase
MPEGIYLGFDFGIKRIGVAVGQRLTGNASPLPTLSAKQGIPEWQLVERIIKDWQPSGLVVGLPKRIDDKEQYTTSASRGFARQLRKRFNLPVHLEDERLSTKEARAHLFDHGGYRQLQKSNIDSIAACIILEQWLQHPPG